MAFPVPTYRCELPPRTLLGLPEQASFQGKALATALVQSQVPAELRGDVSVTRGGRTWFPWRGVEPQPLGFTGEPLAPMSRVDLERLGWTDESLLKAAKALGSSAPDCGPPGPNMHRRWLFVVVMRDAMNPSAG